MKKIIIKIFSILYIRDSGKDMMPRHLWIRWYGFNAKYYTKLWEKLDGNNDEYLFDDFCDACMADGKNISDWMKKLSRNRLNKLFLFSAGMLLHYLYVAAIWETIGFAIDIAYYITMMIFRKYDKTVR